MSWKIEVQTEKDGKWASNALRFATEDEADRYGADLSYRWTMVKAWRAVECQDEVTHSFECALREEKNDGTTLKHV